MNSLKCNFVLLRCVKSTPVSSNFDRGVAPIVFVYFVYFMTSSLSGHAPAIRSSEPLSTTWQERVRCNVVCCFQFQVGISVDYSLYYKPELLQYVLQLLILCYLSNELLERLQNWYAPDEVVFFTPLFHGSLIEAIFFKKGNLNASLSWFVIIYQDNTNSLYFSILCFTGSCYVWTCCGSENKQTKILWSKWKWDCIQALIDGWNEKCWRSLFLFIL